MKYIIYKRNKNGGTYEAMRATNLEMAIIEAEHSGELEPQILRKVGRRQRKENRCTETYEAFLFQRRGTGWELNGVFAPEKRYTVRRTWPAGCELAARYERVG